MKKKYKLCSKNIIVLALAITMALPHTFAVANPADGADGAPVLNAKLPARSLGASLGIDKLTPEEIEKNDLFATYQEADVDVDGILQHRTVDYLRGGFSTEEFASFIKILEKLQPEIERSLKANPDAAVRIRYINTDNQAIEKEIPLTQFQRILKHSKRTDVQVYNPDEATKSFFHKLTLGIFKRTTRTDVKFAITRFFANGILSTISIALSHHPLPTSFVEGLFLATASASFAIFRAPFSDYVNRAWTKGGELARWGIFEVPFVGSLLAIDAYYGLYPERPIESLLAVSATIMLSIFSQGNGDTIIIDRAKLKIAEGQEQDDNMRAQRLAAEKEYIFDMSDKQFSQITNKAEYQAIRGQQILTTLNSVTSVVIAALKTAAENAHAKTLIHLSWAAYGLYGGFGWLYMAKQKLQNGGKIRDLFDVTKLMEVKEEYRCQSLFL